MQRNRRDNLIKQKCGHLVEIISRRILQITEKMVPPAGIEPAAPGLGNRFGRDQEGLKIPNLLHHINKLSCFCTTLRFVVFCLVLSYFYHTFITPPLMGNSLKIKDLMPRTEGDI
jgi:hypothetical protein